MADDGYGGAPIVRAAAGAPAQDDGYGGAPIVRAGPDLSRGTADEDPGNPLVNFWRDWTERAAAANQQMKQSLQAAGSTTSTPADQVIHAAGLPSPSDIKNSFGIAGGALGVATAPFMAAGDQVIGRPAAVVANRVNQATGFAPDYVADPHAITDVASIVTPFAEAAATNRAISAGAKAAGVSESVYVAREAAKKAAAEAAARAARAAKAPGPVQQVVEPFAAAVSPQAAETQAARQFAGGLENPGAVAGALDADQEIVAGSKPTTFQATGDMGAGAMERADRTANPGVYQQRAAEQNAARLQAMPQPEGEPMALAQSVKEHLNTVDADTQAAVEAAQKTAAAKTEGIGGAGTPEASGAALRDTISEAESAARAHEGRLWGAIDPEGKLTGNVTATRQAARDIAENEPETAQPMGSQEAAVFDTAANLPDIAPVRNLTALRTWVNTTMRQELLQNGRSAAYARLSRLRQAIQDNLANSIGEAVQSGQIDQSALNAFEQLKNEREQFYAQRAQARGGDGGGLGDYASGGPRPVPGAGGTEVPPAGQSSNAAGAEGVSGQSQQPNIDPGYQQRLAQATAATKERAQTFGVQPVSNITATRGQQGDFRLPDGQVPAAVFRPGVGGYDRVAAALKAGGDRARQIIEDYAAMSLRRAAQRSDGSIDPDKFARWQAAHQDSLRALPEATRARLADAAEAGRAVNEAATAREEALKAAQAGTLGQLLGVTDPAEVTRVVGAVFNKPDSVTRMKALVSQVRGNPQALAGLRQAVADHITSTYVGNTEAATSGQTLIKADAFQTFVRKNSGALRQVFTPEEMANLHAIAADLQRAKRSENALKLPSQSNTAQDTQGPIRAQFARIGARSMLDMIGAALGAHFGGGDLGAAAGVAVSESVQALRARGIQNVQDLVNRAIREPAFAKALLAKAPDAGTPTTTFQTGVVMRAKALQRALAASGAVSTSENDQQP